MIPSRGPMLLLALILVTGATAAPGNTVYKWKDASGGLHFSDTPPPAGATLISGPKAAVPHASAESQPDCRADISADECVKARAALQRDAEDLARETPASDPARRESDDRRVVDLRAQECAHLRQTRAALERRRSGESNEILTDEERAAVPASIADVDSKIGETCKAVDVSR
jgi:hypothetical protein